MYGCGKFGNKKEKVAVSLIRGWRLSSVYPRIRNMLAFITSEIENEIFNIRTCNEVFTARYVNVLCYVLAKDIVQPVLIRKPFIQLCGACMSPTSPVRTCKNLH
jgi:hypothetical protein